MKFRKQYPMNGPTLEMQRVRLSANPTEEQRERMRQYAKELRSKNGRTETAQAYEL